VAGAVEPITLLRPLRGQTDRGLFRIVQQDLGLEFAEIP
jgi:hypothetical protein